MSAADQEFVTGKALRGHRIAYEVGARELAVAMGRHTETIRRLERRDQVPTRLAALYLHAVSLAIGKQTMCDDHQHQRL